ncbi:MAG TPA: EamA family transporter [Candidatus Limnocylindria bacterium]
MAFALVVIIGGSNFVAVRFSNQGLAPYWGATLRFFLAAILFFAIAALRHRALPRGAALVGAIVYGSLNFGVSYALAYQALVDAPAALASVVVALVPLITLLLAAATGLERLQARGVGGALVSTAGVAIVFGDQLSLAVPARAMLLLLGFAAAIAASTVAAKRFPRSDPIATNAAGLVPGVALLFVLSLLAGEDRSLPTLPQAQLALAWLVTVGTVGLFAGVLFVLGRWTASASSYATVLFPLVTTALGAILARELVGPQFLIGTLLVIAGVYVGTTRPAAKPAGVPAPAR